MNASLIDHYRAYGLFTNPGPYADALRALPDDPRVWGPLLRRQIVHRVTLANGNTLSNTDKRYGDMTKMPWWRQCEDDDLPTAAAMLAELFRRDPRSFVEDRREADRLVVTCRYVAVLAAAILKSKGFPSRVRSGFDPYTPPKPGVSCDHWITQYWKEDDTRWVTIDIDCCREDLDFDPYDMPEGVFDWAADAWLALREGTAPAERFWNAGGHEGLQAAGWELLYDFHCVMGSEILYLHAPRIVALETFASNTPEQMAKLDGLARLMLDPDANFDALRAIWDTDAEMRMLRGGLL